MFDLSLGRDGAFLRYYPDGSLCFEVDFGKIQIHFNLEWLRSKLESLVHGTIWEKGEPIEFSLLKPLRYDAVLEAQLRKEWEEALNKPM